MNHTTRRILCVLFLLVLPLTSFADDPKWVNLSSKTGALPVPGESTQQTGSLVADLDRDGVTDFVISFRVVAPALVWYRRTRKGWDRYVIEKDFLTVEAGGASYDIDGDGDLDIVFGGDGQSNQVWWWENPAPNFNPNVSWQRRLIKNSGANQHHDQAFGDFRGAGKAQLAFWNQKAKTIFLADIPPNEKLKDPRSAEPWPMIEMFSGDAGEVGDQSGAFKYAEGMTAADVDGDGKLDIFAAEMAKWKEKETKPDNDKATAFILYGDGKGHFRKTEMVVGHGFHETRVADLDGDGDLDILNKPSNWEAPRVDVWLNNGTGKVKTKAPGKTSKAAAGTGASFKGPDSQARGGEARRPDDAPVPARAMERGL